MARRIALGFGVAALVVAGLAFTSLAAERSAHGTIVYFVQASPASATNVVNTDHTITATATDSISGNPLVGYGVNFDVQAGGPNQGATGQGTTDANGQATFTYTGSGGPGTDTIQVCIFLPLINRAAAPGLQAPLDCDNVTKTWINPTPTPSPSPTLAPTAAPTSTPTLAAAALPPTGSQTGRRLESAVGGCCRLRGRRTRLPRGRRRPQTRTLTAGRL